ncbi:hypothetical protein GCM10010423_70160 [Streptomyces levis]|uniref:Three-Cys-motif partner protein TcmP n=1 Tax=Streptomyces levis TaxID=285566 RepID=A0ABN3P2C4_9ACTN
MGVLWPLEPATAATHRLYQRYLDAWWPILLQTSRRTGYSRPQVTLLDAFAGPGRYEGGEPGSPVFILDRLLNHTAVDRMNLTPERVHLAFIEKDRARNEHLVSELTGRFGDLSELPVRVEVRRGEAGRDSIAVLSELGDVSLVGLRTPLLAVLGVLSVGLCQHFEGIPEPCMT